MVCLCIVYTYISRLDKVIVLQVSPIMEAPVSRAYGTCALLLCTLLWSKRPVSPPLTICLCIWMDKVKLPNNEIVQGSV